MNEPTLLIAHNYVPILSLLRFEYFAVEQRVDEYSWALFITYIIDMLTSA